MSAASILNCELTVRLGKDLNWWIEKATGKIPWDLDEGIGILDPRQVSYLLDLLDDLRDYGLKPDMIESTFLKFSIKKELPRRDSQGRLHLVSHRGSERYTHQHLFWLPDILDEEKGPYAEFIQHIVDIQVQVLNEVCDFRQPLTTDAFNAKIREKENTFSNNGSSKHFFNDLITIIEDIPRSYECYVEEREEEFVEIEDEDIDDENVTFEPEETDDYDWEYQYR